MTSDRLFEVEDEKSRRSPASVRATKGHERLYRIAGGTIHVYVRALDPDHALTRFPEHRKFPSAEWVVTEVNQSDIDDMVETDPKLAGRLRRL